jgi:MEMO1 family protein
MEPIRPAAVSGAFYPGQPSVLSETVLALLAKAAPDTGAAIPKALIVPHAGYIYSGATAALAYARLAGARKQIRRVVLLGPVHRVPVRGLALPGAAAFATPLGEVQIDQAAVATLADLPQVVVSAPAHAREHALEVQLPFLQSVLDDFKLVPLAVGNATPAEVAQVLERLWGGPETLIVISTDLSHFLPYRAAQTLDQETVQHIMNFGDPLTHEQACGGTPVNGLMLAARQHGLQAQLLGLCNSGDTAGDKNRVVGYAAIAFVAGQRDGRTQAVDRGATLLPIARAAISRTLGHVLTAAEHAPWLQQVGASFVTLTQNGQLRGCIGSLEARRPLLADIKANAIAAALRDPRFAPLTATELTQTEIEVSVLSPMQAMRFDSEAQALAQLRPGIDGVLFEYQQYRSTFLPQVWEQLPSPPQFMAHLKHKAGLGADFWAEGVRLQRYTVAKWKEADYRKAGP